MTVSEPSAPSAPSRVRLVRPSFYRAERTGSLAPDVRDLLIGLTTMADDMGWMLWRPAELAASLYPYAPAGRRLRDLDRRVAVLVERELVILEACGCAFLPTLKQDHAVKGGQQSVGVWGWHERHKSVALRTTTDISVPSSVSDSVSVRDSVSDSERDSSRAHEGTPPPVCVDCRRPTSVHASDCPVLVNPALSRVASA